MPSNKFTWLNRTLFSLAFYVAALALAPSAPAQTPAPDAATRTLGTVKAITGSTLTLTLDADGERNVLVQPATRILRVAPGQKDLKQATPIALTDLQPGDRILVRGQPSADGKSLTALSLIVMAKSDVAAKQANDREEWQKHGLGGLVNAVDPANSTITIAVTVSGEKKDVLIHIAKNTVLRRYAPDSVKFDDAAPAPLDKVKPGDQLRARGTRATDSGELAADEVVSGTFRNIAGAISKCDVQAATIVVQDLTTKKSFTVKITADSQLRKLTAPAAQRIAARLKGENNSSGAAAAAPASSAPGAPSSPSPESAAAPRGPSSSAASGSGRGDLQQMLANVPPTTLAELQKGDAVMIVTTEGTDNSAVTAISLLAGVEPLLQASPKGGSASILSPWSLGAAPGGDSGTP